MPKRQITIVACGLSPENLSAKACTTIEGADVILAAPRLLELYAPSSVKQAPYYLADDVVNYLQSHKYERAVVLVSGDSGFYSAASSIVKTIGESGLCSTRASLALCEDPCQLEIIPGISSLNYFFARLQRPWQKAKLVSCHGRSANLISAVRRNQEVFALTGNNVPEILEDLVRYGFSGLQVSVGENLGQPDERVYKASVQELTSQDDFPSLTVLLIDNPMASRAIRSGIRDEEFVRDGLPMTKSEIRSSILSKLAIEPTDICLDLGSGTGSVAIEMGLAAYEGKVHAVDLEAEAGVLLEKNMLKFQVDNISFEQGDLLDFVARQKHFDKVFLGGGGPQVMGELIPLIFEKNTQAKLVMTMISLDSLTAGLKTILAHQLDYRISQITVAKSRLLGGHNMLFGENPIFVLEVEAKND